MKKLSGSIFFLMSIIIITLFAFVSYGSELEIPQIKAAPGQTIRIPIIVEKVDNLAGLKLTVEYDTEILTYRDGRKTSHTDSMMHIVNDKNPGRLIIVMAGARGVKGEQLPVFSLLFDINPNLKGNRNAGLSIKEVQLMSDKLEEFSSKVYSGTVYISSEP